MFKMTEHRISLTTLAESMRNAAHSIFGASKAHMYFECPGSLIPNLFEPDESGPDAAYGTVAHMVTEQWLLDGRAPEHLIGTNEFIESGDWGHLVWIDEEMLAYAEQCVDRCEFEQGDHLVEVRVDFSHLTPIPHQGGTLDFAALQPGRATVKDHKFGSSPENIVYAEENPQLMLYTVGLMRDPRYQHYEFEDFIIAINQPRLDHFDEWHTTRSRLIEFEEYARERMALAWQYDAPRKPGTKQCRFCKVKASCPALAKMQHDLTAAVFTDTTQDAKAMKSFVSKLDGELGPFDMFFASVPDLTTEQMARLLPYRSMAESWWKALEEALLQRSKSGEKVPGMKLVEARTHRKFTSESKARSHLLSLGLKREDIIKESLVSPNQAETLLRSKLKHKTADLPALLEGLVTKPPGDPTLVPVTDRRPEIGDVTEAVFGPVVTRETQEEL